MVRASSWLSLSLSTALATCMTSAFCRGSVLSFNCTIALPQAYKGIEIGYVIDTDAHQVLSDSAGRTERVSVSDEAVSWESRNVAGYSRTVVDLMTGNLVIASMVGDLFRGTCGIATLR